VGGLILGFPLSLNGPMQIPRIRCEGSAHANLVLIALFYGTCVQKGKHSLRRQAVGTHGSFAVAAPLAAPPAAVHDCEGRRGRSHR
jgi:hypothetical protein